MALVKPDVGRFARIKVVGVGGGGGNALNSMIASSAIGGVDFIAVNTATSRKRGAIYIFFSGFYIRYKRVCRKV